MRKSNEKSYLCSLKVKFKEFKTEKGQRHRIRALIPHVEIGEPNARLYSEMEKLKNIQKQGFGALSPLQ